ncbi:MAG: hypothetical protein NTX50_17060 [Candidatus Sumerlaeota bacterium]|nr:hypothetical protein [Candidatus Sumerlaeota bacterium]
MTIKATYKEGKFWPQTQLKLPDESVVDISIYKDNDSAGTERFIKKIAFFNSFGFTATTVGTTFIDARITTVLWPPRSYHLGYWIAVAFPIVFLATYFGLKWISSWRAKAIFPSLILFLFGALSLRNFLPEFPHMGICVWVLAYALISFVTCWTYFSPFETSWLFKSNIDAEFKKERIKELITFWRTISVSLAFGYMALFVPWAAIQWNLVEKIVSDRAEIALLGNYSISMQFLVSAYIILGLICEGFGKANKAADLLLEIN